MHIEFYAKTNLNSNSKKENKETKKIKRNELTMFNLWYNNLVETIFFKNQFLLLTILNFK